jgi:hypothetical protein
MLNNKGYLLLHCLLITIRRRRQLCHLRRAPMLHCVYHSVIGMELDNALLLLGDKIMENQGNLIRHVKV